jgi:hypothetical protein
MCGNCTKDDQRTNKYDDKHANKNWFEKMWKRFHESPPKLGVLVVGYFKTLSPSVKKLTRVMVLQPVSGLPG